MILTVTLNAALDVTYGLEHVRLGEANRVASVAERAGGKGVNVARVLHGLGIDVIATGLAGGTTGAQIHSDLDATGIPHDFAPTGGESRRTVTLVAGETTLLNEPGAHVTAAEYDAFSARFDALLVDRPAVVVLSGSLPRGVADDVYADLICRANAAGAATILDADGEPLLHGVSAGPRVVKPNADELRAATGADDVAAACDALRAAGAGAVVASRGAEGILAVTPEGRWRARPPAPVSGNATGAGDALVAGLARGIADRRGWQDTLADAVALSAAAVAHPQAGSVDTETYEQNRRTVQVDRF